jgi:CheY-like chemotaxis protein
MTSCATYEILVVDDDSTVRESLAMVLNASGYSVRTAEQGFDGLRKMGQRQPAIVISDLNMPEMSGFEFLSVVRRRFPQVSVIAMSGAYESRDDVPCVIADAFYPKGQGDPSMLLLTLSELVRTSDALGLAHQKVSAPVWIRSNGEDSKGTPYVLLTCTECLRSFPSGIEHDASQAIQETACVFCQNQIRFVVDFSGKMAVSTSEYSRYSNSLEQDCVSLLND